MLTSTETPPQQKTARSSVTNVTPSSPKTKRWNNTCFKCTATSHTSATAARLLSATRATWPATRLSTQVRLTRSFPVWHACNFIYLFILASWILTGFLWLFSLCFQGRSRIAVIFVVLSSTDQLTSRLTLASTQERSHTNVRRAALVLYR